MQGWLFSMTGARIRFKTTQCQWHRPENQKKIGFEIRSKHLLLQQEMRLRNEWLWINLQHRTMHKFIRVNCKQLNCLKFNFWLLVSHHSYRLAIISSDGSNGQLFLISLWKFVIYNRLIDLRSGEKIETGETWGPHLQHGKASLNVYFFHTIDKQIIKWRMSMLSDHSGIDCY